jgi:hypothetical protein
MRKNYVWSSIKIHISSRQKCLRKTEGNESKNNAGDEYFPIVYFQFTLKLDGEYFKDFLPLPCVSLRAMMKLSE